jgi:hypothetical protein
MKRVVENVRRARAVWLSLCVIALVLAHSAAVRAEYIAVWRAGGESQSILILNTWGGFVAKWNELDDLGYHLTDVEISHIKGVPHYIGSWRKGKVKQGLYKADGWEAFVAKWNEQSDKGYRLVDIEARPMKEGNAVKVFYVGVWAAGTDGHGLYRFESFDALADKADELDDKGLRLADVEVFRLGDHTYYLGAWRAGAGASALREFDDWEDLKAVSKEMESSGVRPFDIESWRVSGKPHYVALWGQGNDAQNLRWFDEFGDFAADSKALGAKQNYRMVKFSAVEVYSEGKPAAKPGSKALALKFNNSPRISNPVSKVSFPPDMPPIRYPKYMGGCDEADQALLNESWAKAHYYTWRAYQLIEYLDRNPDDRADMWADGYITKTIKPAELLEHWSPRRWFGSYRDSRFRYRMMREVISKLWHDRFLAKKYSFEVKCRQNENNKGAHPCYATDPSTGNKPSANHIALGTINFCNAWFKMEDGDRELRVIHELLHWLSAKGLYVSDLHTHSDKNSNNVCATEADKMYGWDKAVHLAESTGCWGSATLHREMATRNNDNYAHFIYAFGRSVFMNELKQFPTDAYFNKK